MMAARGDALARPRRRVRGTWGESLATVPPGSPPAVHLPGERVCPYLLATGKAGADRRFADDPVFHACLVQMPEVTARHPDIGRRVKRAARSGFVVDNLRHKKAALDSATEGVDAQNDPEAA